MLDGTRRTQMCRMIVIVAKQESRCRGGSEFSIMVLKPLKTNIILRPAVVSICGDRIRIEVIRLFVPACIMGCPGIDVKC